MTHQSKHIAAISTLTFLILCTLMIKLSRFVNECECQCPEPSILCLDRSGEFLCEIKQDGDSESGYWPLTVLPDRITKTVILLEDKRFFHHPGVDTLALLRAVVQNVSEGKRISGASTIAMQIARLQNPGARTYVKKIKEACFALVLTATHSRKEILSHYLRIAPYGNGIRGIACAARYYFDKPVEDLSWAEIAFLCAIPQSPSERNPYESSGHQRIIDKAKNILAALNHSGCLSEAEYSIALKEMQTLYVKPPNNRPPSAIHSILKLEELASKGILQSDDGSNIIHTTLDISIQDEIQIRLKNKLESLYERGAGNGAVILLDLQNQTVMGWVGSSGYFDEAHSGAIDFSEVKRSSGSTLKPFIYVLAFETNTINPTTVLDDIDRGAGGVTNADESFLGPLLPRAALANSRNVPAVNVLSKTGLETCYAFLKDLGLHNGEKPASFYGCGMAIGGLPVTLENLVTAYTIFTNDGLLGNLNWAVSDDTQNGKRVISASSARQISLFLSDPMARLPAFPRMGNCEYDYSVALKTGTSSNYRDAWTIAFSRKYLVGVWIGHPDARPMNRVSGYNSAAALAKEILDYVHERKYGDEYSETFPPPEGAIPVTLCGFSGKLASPLSTYRFDEWLLPENAPTEISEVVIQKQVDSRTGYDADASTPSHCIVNTPIINLPSRYAHWACYSSHNIRSFLGPIKNNAYAKAQHMIADVDEKKAIQDVPVSLRITSPDHQINLIRDPESPTELCSLSLKIDVNPPQNQIVWYVDGRPYQTSEFPYSIRWPLEQGHHWFQAHLPFREEASNIVSVNVL
ncbi:transglycosylase domain-containing protein [bacterium]|nr:transglycosylase domain-containing protein [candidate division CSSED10-310 bacterium]